MSDMASKYRALGDKAKAMMFDESFQQYFYDAAKEFERLTADSEKLTLEIADVVLTNERLQAKVEALEVVKDAAQSFIDGEGWESLYELSGALSNLAATEQGEPTQCHCGRTLDTVGRCEYHGLPEHEGET